MRKVKIVCTLGPACNDLEGIREMVATGLNVAYSDRKSVV